MPDHVTSWARVNAPVDRDIVLLVEALSLFPKVETIESCQGNSPEPAWVCFRYGDYWLDPWRGLANFVFGFLAPRLTTSIGDAVRLSVQMHQTGVAIADLYVQQDVVDQTVEALRQIRAEFSEDPCHSWACSDGTSDTWPLSC